MPKLFPVLCAFFLLSGLSFRAQSQCPSGQSQVSIVIVQDNFPNEISWELRNVQTNALIASGGAVGQTLCVPDNVCLKFTIFDSYGDGICCGYGNGSYTVTLNGNLIATGGNYTNFESTYFNCPPGFSCNTAVPVTPGSYFTSTNDYWYAFTPSATGTYEITTCGLNNCDTKVWVYDHCVGLTYDNSNIGTIFYDDNNGGCGQQAVVTAFLAGGTTYYIRLGTVNNSCPFNINWTLNYVGPVVGCMDPTACNFNPLASVNGTCYYPGNPNCPNAPDLTVLQNVIHNSLQMDFINSNDGCLVAEGCVGGYGLREILRFTTHIKNIGDADYYLGAPGGGNNQFTFDNCHGHWHYEGYAQYLLYDYDGNLMPIGYKNGFCVMDLECSGGGSFQYGCGNQGISAGCGDIYSSGLMCQWVDMTDLDTGNYILVVKVNWDESPDALGRVESSFQNNHAKACVKFMRDIQGNPSFQLLPSCPDIVDCNGTPYGNVQADCNGDCGGVLVHGDMNADTLQQTADALLYVTGILNASVAVSPCKDLNNDSRISVYDAALINNCAINGQPFNDLCTFPRGILNTNDTVTLSMAPVNLADGYVDIYVRNPTRKLLGYQFKMKGIKISGVQNLASPLDFPVTPQYLNGGNEVIALAYQEHKLPKYLVNTPLCRIYYSELTDSVICIEEIIDIVNENYEQTLKQVEGPCFQHAFASVSENEAVQWALFPNPADEQMFISLQQPGEADLNIRWIDATGRVVLQEWIPRFTGGQLRFSVEDLTNGLYTVSLTSEYIRESKVLVVNHTAK